MRAGMTTTGRDKGVSWEAIPLLRIAGIALSDELCVEICSMMDILVRTIGYGRIVGHVPSRSEIKTWLQASFQVRAGRITEVVLMGRGIFML